MDISEFQFDYPFSNYSSPSKEDFQISYPENSLEPWEKDKEIDEFLNYNINNNYNNNDNNNNNNKNNSSKFISLNDEFDFLKNYTPNPQINYDFNIEEEHYLNNIADRINSINNTEDFNNINGINSLDVINANNYTNYVNNGDNNNTNVVHTNANINNHAPHMNANINTNINANNNVNINHTNVDAHNNANNHNGYSLSYNTTNTASNSINNYTIDSEYSSSHSANLNYLENENNLNNFTNLNNLNFNKEMDNNLLKDPENLSQSKNYNSEKYLLLQKSLNSISSNYFDSDCLFNDSHLNVEPKSLMETSIDLFPKYPSPPSSTQLPQNSFDYAATNYSESTDLSPTLSNQAIFSNQLTLTPLMSSNEEYFSSPELEPTQFASPMTNPPVFIPPITPSIKVSQFSSNSQHPNVSNDLNYSNYTMEPASPTPKSKHHYNIHNNYDNSNNIVNNKKNNNYNNNNNNNNNNKMLSLLSNSSDLPKSSLSSVYLKDFMNGLSSSSSLIKNNSSSQIGQLQNSSLYNLTPDLMSPSYLPFIKPNSDINQPEITNKKKPEDFISGPDEYGKYTCMYKSCGKLFNRRYNIHSHIQTHLEDRPHQCQECGHRFVRHHDLLRHQKIHVEVKPYECPCGKSFARNDALTRHRTRMICIGGIEPPNGITRKPGKRGRPKKIQLDKNNQVEII